MAKIFIIDDDPTLSKMVRDWLLSDKHEPRICHDGAESLEILRSEQFDLLLVDWDLPGMTGLEICKAYRASGGMTPILMLTGRSDVDEKELALDAGADDYLTKPFHIKELSARIRSLLRRSTGALASSANTAQVKALSPDVRVCVVCSGIFTSALMEKCPSDGATTIAICTEAVLGKQIGEYVATRLLGAGAWSEVYEGKAEGREPVALKILHTHLASDPLKITRFEREARALLGIKHHSIAQVVDSGKAADGRPYIVMEYIKGSSIEKCIRESGAIPLQSALNFFVMSCEALEAAHRTGFIHRDIKPSNIFLTDEVPAQIKIMDFGLAKAVTADGGALASLTQAGEILGTPAYMSPEQVRGESLDVRSDIYAMGLVLYEMLSGVRAIDGNTAFEVMTKHLSQYPSSIAEVNRSAHVPSALEDVIFKAMAKDADDRHQSAAELKEQVLPFLTSRNSMPAK